MKIKSISYLLFFLLVISISFNGYGIDDNEINILYRVSIVNPQEGVIDITAIFNKPISSDLVLSEQNLSEYINLKNLKASDLKGKSLKISSTEGDIAGYDRLYKQNIYTIASKGIEQVKFEYSIKPGVLGKHGHRGYLDRHFGLVPGKSLFLFPLDDISVNRITIDFNIPHAWKVFCPWPKEGEIFIIERNQYRFPLHLADILCEAVIGFGNFNLRQRSINGFNISIYMPSEWTNEHINGISEQAFRLVKYQLDLFGIDAQWDYTVIFVPNASDKGRVFGGSWSLGQGFEMEIPTARSWELFSHRFHHMFNYYYPFGMYMIKKSSEWFLEATASYYELKALAVEGYYSLEDRLRGLKSDYDSLKIEHDAPLSSHYKHQFFKVEYLHYVKAPLVGYLMDEKIKKDTKGKKDLDKFLKFIYLRHGMKSSAVNLKDELEEFTGSNFDDFFQKYVDGLEPIKLGF